MSRYLKTLVWMFVALCALAAVIAATFVWKSRDYQATQTTLAQANLPSLIPLNYFYADMNATWEYAPSAAGKYYKYKGTIWGEEVLFVSKMYSDKAKLHLNEISSSEWTDIPNILHAWHNNRLYKIDVERPERKNWTDITPIGFKRYRFDSPPFYENKRRWVLSRRQQDALPDLYQTDLNGRNRKLLEKNDGHIGYWIPDRSLNPFLRMKLVDRDYRRVEFKDDGGVWKPVLQFAAEDYFNIIRVNDDGTSFLAHSSINRDKRVLVNVEIRTGEETVVLSDDAHDIGRFFGFDRRNPKVDLALSAVNETKLFPASNTGELIAKIVTSYGENTDIGTLRYSPDGSFVFLELAPDAIGYHRLFVNLSDGTVYPVQPTGLLEHFKTSLVSTEEVVFQARDGVELHGYLSKPKGVEEPVPLVIRLHGGPASHYSLSHDTLTQFLVNRGYAVLWVNFRGSTGYGKVFQQLGFREFGRAMQSDVEDTADWAIREGVADPNAVAVMGTSYGGYSAILAIIQRPDLFAAAIAEHPIIDLAHQQLSIPDDWIFAEKKLINYFGDPMIDDELGAMNRYSPKTYAKELSIPLLIVAGHNDKIIDIATVNQFLDNAEHAPEVPETLIFANEGHRVLRWQNKVKRARKIEEFLHAHLGGRSGGWHWSELAAEYLKAD